MPRYFVVDYSGARYGPAELPLLNQWAVEGRVAAATVIVEEGTGIQMAASEVPGLVLPHPGTAPSQFGGPPYGNAYGPGFYGSDGARQANLSFLWSGISAASCACVPLFGIPLALMAIYCASVSMKRGCATGRSALAVAILALAIQAALLFGILTLPRFD